MTKIRLVAALLTKEAAAEVMLSFSRAGGYV
jgi:hypothetical protein